MLSVFISFHYHYLLFIYSVVLSCILGGTTRVEKGRIRQDKSVRQGCLFTVYVMLSTDGQSLEVKRMDSEHNHSLSMSLFHTLPPKKRTG